MSDDSVLDAIDALIAALKQENRQDEDKSIIHNDNDCLEPQNQFHIAKQATTRNHAVDDEKSSTDSASNSVLLRSSTKTDVASGFVVPDIRAESGAYADF